MNIFKQKYTVRRYGKTERENGVLSSPYTDLQLMLDVQARTRTNQNDMGGRYITGSLTVYSDVELLPAEPSAQQAGDRLLYMGKWYVCKSAVYWGNTILKHWIGEFEAVEGEEDDDDTE